MKKIIEHHCNFCNVKYDKKEIKRIYGKESRPYLLGYCSAACYTKDVILKEEKK